MGADSVSAGFEQKCVDELCGIQGLCMCLILDDAVERSLDFAKGKSFVELLEDVHIVGCQYVWMGRGRWSASPN